MVPGGAPAAVIISAMITGVIKANGDGLYTIVLPQANAGATFHEQV